MSRPRFPGATRTRVVRTTFVVLLALAIGTTSASADGGDVGSGPLVDLAPIDSGHVEPAAGLETGGAAVLPGATEGGAASVPASDDLDDPVTGTVQQLRTRRAQLVAQRDELQRRMLGQEQERQRAELEHDAALQAVAAALVTLFDAGQGARVQALIAIRDEQDPERRAELLAALHVDDRALIERADTALAEVTRLASAADATRAKVLEVGTQVAAVDAAIESRLTPDEAGLAKGERSGEVIDADYVFATGPIPGIGYWGAASGGGVLEGWMGYVGAAMGGVGCEPQDPNLRATGSVETGEASWYGPGFQGNSTANGEVFDTNQMTAAHKTLPFGTIVRVYSSQTARCAFVRINDRGPYVDGRVIDLSRAAADAIGMESVAPVQLEVYAAP